MQLIVGNGRERPGAVADALHLNVHVPMVKAFIPQNSALTSAGAELFVTPRLTLLVKFDGEFAPGSQTYAGSGTLRYSW
jgi:hypothetical protein